jgi:hypothetical protein
LVGRWVAWLADWLVVWCIVWLDGGFVGWLMSFVFS